MLLCVFFPFHFEVAHDTKPEASEQKGLKLPLHLKLVSQAHQWHHQWVNAEAAKYLDWTAQNGLLLVALEPEKLGKQFGLHCLVDVQLP